MLQFKVIPAIIKHLELSIAGGSNIIKFNPYSALINPVKKKDNSDEVINAKDAAIKIAISKIFDKFIDAHYDTTVETKDNQFLSASNKQNYGIVLNHQISDTVNELNQFSTGDTPKERKKNLQYI